MKTQDTGKLVRINGPVVTARGLPGAFKGEQVDVGEERLAGEVIELQGDTVIIQVYEDTGGLLPGEPARRRGYPLSVELGPGLVGRTFDGIQRPLREQAEAWGNFIRRGGSVSVLPRERKWEFVPTVRVGDEVGYNDVLGTVEETGLVVHKILCPHPVAGKVVEIAPRGEYTVEDTIAVVDTGTEKKNIRLFHRWPVRKGRPYRERLEPSVPLLTGQRVIDFLFPLAKGGAAAVPGGFGTGKTVTQHQLAKWSDADIIVYIGCGERGNEMAQVLTEFPALKDPRSGRSLMERTILIANTSNMPVTAREASIYTGITIAEYYRDMGYDVAVMADSTSRWAEALREISGRLEEIPAEEGFPAYLASALSEFYERGGRVVVNERGDEGSVSVIGAVSPPGGDFSEPVTQHTRRFIRTFWGLDKQLAGSRHFPSINWNTSYSEYTADLAAWWEERFPLSWKRMREEVMEILKEDTRLQHIIQLIGPDALPDRQRLVVEAARIIKEGFLRQNAFDPRDAFCTPEKQLALADVLLYFYREAERVVEEGVPIVRVLQMDIIEDLFRLKTETEVEKIQGMKEKIDGAFAAVKKRSP